MDPSSGCYEEGCGATPVQERPLVETLCGAGFSDQQGRCSNPGTVSLFLSPDSGPWQAAGAARRLLGPPAPLTHAALSLPSSLSPAGLCLWVPAPRAHVPQRPPWSAKAEERLGHPAHQLPGEREGPVP